jgi:hypothetical protein
MQGRPEPGEAAPYYFRYIDQVPGDGVIGVLAAQMEQAVAFLGGIGEERSLYRYAPEKWSFREVLNHVSDTERLFLFRAFWFARGFDTPLPSFDEKVSAGAARADEISWARHIEEFQASRLATLTVFRNLPAAAWMRSGIASDSSFTVRAAAYIVAGHAVHHLAILQERYL